MKAQLTRERLDEMMRGHLARLRSAGIDTQRAYYPGVQFSSRAALQARSLASGSRRSGRMTSAEAGAEIAKLRLPQPSNTIKQRHVAGKAITSPNEAAELIARLRHQELVRSINHERTLRLEREQRECERRENDAQLLLEARRLLGSVVHR